MSASDTSPRTVGPRAQDAGGAGPLFEFAGVEVERGDLNILQVTHLTIPPTGVTALTGPSGAGKSTLLRLCNRLEVPTRGIVRFRAHDLGAIDPLQLRRRVGMVFQRSTLFAGTVRDNLEVAAPDAGASAYIEALARAGLDADLLDRPGAALSGGEAQRACIARALLTEPEALLLDEPTSALDGRARKNFEDLAAGLARHGIPLVWVTHDLEQLWRVADRVVVVEAGRVAYEGSLHGLSGDRRLMTLLTGEA